MKPNLQIGPKHLLFTIVSLLVLWATSWGLSYAPIGSWGKVVVALSIAALQLSLVLVFFMELGQHRGGLRFVAATAPLWAAIMILLMLGDVWTR